MCIFSGLLSVLLSRCKCSSDHPDLRYPQSTLVLRDQRGFESISGLQKNSTTSYCQLLTVSYGDMYHNSLAQPEAIVSQPLICSVHRRRSNRATVRCAVQPLQGGAEFLHVRRRAVYKHTRSTRTRDRKPRPLGHQNWPTSIS